MDIDTWFFTRREQQKEETMAIATLPRPFALIEGGAPEMPEPDLDADEEWALTVHALAGTCAHYYALYAALLAHGPLGEAIRPLENYRLLRGILARMVGHDLAALLISERM